jgi:hypothetical protein
MIALRCNSYAGPHRGLDPLGWTEDDYAVVDSETWADRIGRLSSVMLESSIRDPKGKSYNGRPREPGGVIP